MARRPILPWADGAIARRPVLAGIFVGGRSSRMGTTKGLLRAPGEARTLVARAADIFRALGVPVALVGEHAEYTHMGLPMLPDAFSGIGPLGGLVALLAANPTGDVIACACDLPYVSEALAKMLLAAPPARAVTPVAEGVLQPLFARYAADEVLPIARRRGEDATRGGSPALQGLLAEVGATPLALTLEQEAELRDWDSPSDVER
ncbi:MAG: molybdenum cofactor guanylyltransferase [Polyangiaceae bacterium]